MHTKAIVVPKSIALHASLFIASRRVWGVTELHERVNQLKNRGVKIHLDYCDLDWPWWRKVDIGPHELWLPRHEWSEGLRQPVCEAELRGPRILLEEQLRAYIDHLTHAA